MYLYVYVFIVGSKSILEFFSESHFSARLWGYLPHVLNIRVFKDRMKGFLPLIFVLAIQILSVFAVSSYHGAFYSRKGSKHWLIRGGFDTAGSYGTVTPPGVECKDGVCELKGGESKPSMSTEEMKEMAAYPADIEERQNAEDLEDKVAECKKLGWDNEDDIKMYLQKSHGDVGHACEMLERNEEEREEIRAEAKVLADEGKWSVEAAESAIMECGRNATAASEMLEAEEAGIQAQFSGAVADMLENGWDEVVARQALLAQWTVDQRKAQGKGHNTSREVLDSIHPTLKRREEDIAKAGASAGEDKKPTPAKKEDCVFEVNAGNFQKLVLESPVPVLVDVYADWCGPCKQLGPVLELAAMNSGGMFRLAKVNSDEERSISQALGVTGLPTVFSVNSGKFTDRFVGMLPQDQMQEFLVRCVSGGMGPRRSDITDEDLGEATRKLSSMAGLAAITFKKREKILNMVDAALDMEGGLEEGGGMSVGVKTALLYIGNAAKDIRSPKKKAINTASKAYSEKVAKCPAAVRMLEIAGYRAREAKDGEENAMVELIHSNPAVLTMVQQRAQEFSSKKKFAKIKKSAVKLDENPSFRAKTDSEFALKRAAIKAEEKMEREAKERAIEEARDTARMSKSKGIIDTGIVVSFRDGANKLKKRVQKGSTLGEALEKLLTNTDHEGWEQLEIKFPLPRKLLTRESEELQQAVNQYSETGVSLGLAKERVKHIGDALAGDGKRPQGAGRKKKRPKKKGMHTLNSFTGKDKRMNEYYGGDSSVTIAGDEEDDSDSEEEE